VRMNAAMTASPCGTFDEVNDYVSVPDHADFDITDNLSVFLRCQYRTSAISPASVLFNKQDPGASQREWSMYISTDERLYIIISDDGTAANHWRTDAALAVENENSLAFTFSAATIKLYVNGSVVAGSLSSGTIPATIFNGTSPVQIGATVNSGTPSSVWDGRIWDCQIWKGSGAVLSAAQMLALHNGQTVTDPNQDQVLWLPFCEYSGTTVYDVSADAATRHNGTINNATTTKGAGFWAQTQDAVHHLARYGGTLSGDVFIPGDPFNAGLDAAGDPLGLQPYKTHEPNLIDFTNGVLAPGTATWETAYVFDASRTNPLFVRDIKSGGVTAASDRLLAYGTALAGDDLTNANEYTADA
jgi:hypothetical protein